MSRTQLRDAGLERAAVRHAVAAGRLFPAVGGQVLLVGHRAPAADAGLHRALLVAGTGAVISHRSAAWVWRLLPEPLRHELTVPSNRRARRLVRLHRNRLAARGDVTWRGGLPVTTVRRTLVDLAAVATGAELDRALNEAAIRGWLRGREVAAILRLSRGRRGAARLRRALAARDRSSGWTRSTLEMAFARFARDAGLPPYKRGALVDIGDGDLRECDVTWPELRVMVELDFLPIHESGLVPYRDRRRDRRLAAAGWTVIRLTGDDLTEHRTETLADLRAALTRVKGAEAVAA